AVVGSLRAAGFPFCTGLQTLPSAALPFCSGNGLIAIMEAVMTISIESQRIPVKANHQPFSWLTEDLHMNRSAQFMALTLDLSQGIKTCLSLIHASNLAREHGDEESPPTLNVSDTECLTRMAIAAAGVLSERAESYIDVFNDMRAGRE
ncbi:hypothetical protein, partial [Collimonas fungivorans]|uniref:hypothetical protein n=1 Tax=Collimonas fungivorans TaxID=158899 RepID=UPI0026ED8C26